MLKSLLPDSTLNDLHNTTAAGSINNIFEKMWILERGCSASGDLGGVRFCAFVCLPFLSWLHFWTAGRIGFFCAFVCLPFYRGCLFGRQGGSVSFVLSFVCLFIVVAFLDCRADRFLLCFHLFGFLSWLHFWTAGRFGFFCATDPLPPLARLITHLIIIKGKRTKNTAPERRVP